MTLPILRRKWDDRLALDLAFTLEGSGGAVSELLDAYRLTEEELADFGRDPQFEKRVNYWRQQAQTEGFTFRVKAKAQAEHLLDTSFGIIHDVDVSPAVKADLIKWTAKMAGYEPTKETLSETSGVKINIIMGDATGVKAGIQQIESQ